MLIELVLGLCVALTPMVLLWLASVPLRNASIVDVYWGPGFVVLTWWSAWRAEVWSTRTILLVACVSIWGLRLGAYLWWRSRGRGEDRRYVAMRERHGATFWLSSLVIVFLLQGGLQWLVSLPVQVAVHRGSNSMQWMHWLGLALVATGIACESIADLQLVRFKSRHASAGLVMDRGLWRYSRHPNYFGDFLVWWGLFGLSWTSLSTGWVVIGPVVMSVFLLWISGVGLLEIDLSKRLPKYAEYIRRTPAFFPWRPRT